MKEIFAVQYTWGQFFLAFVCAGLLIKLLQIMHANSKNYLISGKFKLPLKTFLRKLSLVAEPAAIIAVIGVFASIFPVFNGSLLVVLIFVFFTHLKNYFAGIIILFSDELPTKIYISSGDTDGNVVRIGSLGIKVQTDDGHCFLAFSQLLADGYVLHTEKTGRKLTELKINCPGYAGGVKKEMFLDFLASIPYINWNFMPEISIKDKNNLVVKILLRDNTTLTELDKLFTESGYIMTTND